MERELMRNKPETADHPLTNSQAPHRFKPKAGFRDLRGQAVIEAGEAA
jgi:hypothetical protein